MFSIGSHVYVGTTLVKVTGVVRQGVAPDESGVITLPCKPDGTGKVVAYYVQISKRITRRVNACEVTSFINRKVG